MTLFKFIYFQKETNELIESESVSISDFYSLAEATLRSRAMGRPRSVTNKQILDVARSYFIEHGHTAPIPSVRSSLGISI